MTPLSEQFLDRLASAAVQEGLADAVYTTLKTPIGPLLVVQGARGVLRIAFEALLAPLPETAREPLRLRFVEDLDYDHIARRLGCSQQAARQRVSTAVRTLRERHAA